MLDSVANVKYTYNMKENEIRNTEVTMRRDERYEQDEPQLIIVPVTKEQTWEERLSEKLAHQQALIDALTRRTPREMVN